MRKTIWKTAYRNDVLKFAAEHYGTEPDYPWGTLSNYAVLRHQDNGKWYGLIMSIPGNKLGLLGGEHIDILNVKLDDPLLADMLIQQEGYFKGYHINRGNWVSILLDGTVPFEEICDMIDKSFFVTASKKKKEQLRAPKEWLVPANPQYYDIEHAFDTADTINWKQGKGIKKDDTVFVYVGSPISAILYKCRVMETNIPYNYTDKNLVINSLMKIKLLKQYESDRFPLDILKKEYGIFAVRGPRGIPYSLSMALKR